MRSEVLIEQGEEKLEASTMIEALSSSLTAVLEQMLE